MEAQTKLRELLTATHTFPCAYTLKVVGESALDIEPRVAALIASICPEGQASVRARPSRSGRHVSITVQTQVADADAVLRLYAELRALDGVRMLF